MLTLRFIIFIFCLMSQLKKTVCTNYQNDYISDLLQLGIFDNNLKTINKDILNEINDTHYIFSSCKTCIKLIQLIIKIIKKKKETYIDIAIEDTLELNLCDVDLWKKYFNFNDLMYNEFVLKHCTHTYNLIQYDIENFIYKLYNNEEKFYKKVCGKINYICQRAIDDEKKNNSYNNDTKVKLMYELYSAHLTDKEGFTLTSQKVPYKKISSANNNGYKFINTKYVVIQSKIKTMHQNKLHDDFENNYYRLIQIDK
ncbi:conserved protein, unknown function, partial [Hepatocystis sp. ex Piliocolobus tephrosceles]